MMEKPNIQLALKTPSQSRKYRVQIFSPTQSLPFFSIGVVIQWNFNIEKEK